jgi:hypothetical protein
MGISGTKCFGFIHKKASRCKHCNADLNQTVNEAEFITYINNGLALIDKERAEFEGKIGSMKGKFFFLRHDYSEEELVHSNYVDKIRCIAGKMGSDIENWKVRGGGPAHMRLLTKALKT